MCKISSESGSSSNIETSWNDRDSESLITRNNKNLINKANTVPLSLIFKHFGLHIDENNRKSSCPFHKNGRERTPSFYFYPDTNTFFCFACKAGVTPCDFIARSFKISKVESANKIINLFAEDCSEIFISDENYEERFNLILDFSNYVRNFRQLYNDQKSFDFIENICCIYDKINNKHDLNNEALKLTINKLKKNIESYE